MQIKFKELPFALLPTLPPFDSFLESLKRNLVEAKGCDSEKLKIRNKKNEEQYYGYKETILQFWVHNLEFEFKCE